MNRKYKGFESEGKSGYNVIAETPRNGNGRIVVSSHYDGAGVLDNAQGVAVTLSLMEKLRNEKDITFIFTDLEEQGQLGARAYLERFGKEGITYNVNVDGAGIGDRLVDLSKVRKLNTRLPEGEAEIELRSDADAFKEYGISSVSYATLPENEIDDLIKAGKMPRLWASVLQNEDNLDEFNEKDIESTINKIYKVVQSMDVMRGEI